MSTDTKSTLVKFRLYVAGQGFNSNKALNNLTEFCQRHLDGRHEVEVVDVFKEPQRALQDGVLLTPTLLLLTFQPPRRLVGSLASPQVLLELLGDS